MNRHCADRIGSSSLLIDTVGLIAVVILALLMRFHAITIPAVWYDEAFSLLLARETPWEIWPITARDVHPPLYYVLLHYWMLLVGDDVLSARSLSVLADVGTLLLSIKLMSLVATRRATWIAALLLALLPISIRYSQEVRMYTMVSFWLMGATVALVCWVKAPDKKRFATLYVLLMTAAFYTHYFAALCVLVHWLFWFRVRHVRAAVLPVRAWVLANSAIVVLFLPWMSHFIRQLQRRDGLDWIPPLTWQTVLNTVWPFTVMNDSVPVTSWWRVVPTLLILVCAATLLVKDPKERGYNILLVGYFFVPVLIVYILSLWVPIFSARYLTFAAVGLPLIVAVALDAWGIRRRVLTVAAMFFFLVGETQGLLAVYQQTDGLNGTAVRRETRLDILAARIAREVRPDDEIVVDGMFWYLPFKYYNATGIQPRIYVYRYPTDESREPYSFGGWALALQRGAGRYFDDISTLKLNAGRIWWVTGKVNANHARLFPKHWKQTLRLDGGGVEASLFILDAAPAPLAAGPKRSDFPAMACCAYWRADTDRAIFSGEVLGIRTPYESQTRPIAGP
nr:glycosyltransferase family 39 protein [Pseudomonas silesiensis]